MKTKLDLQELTQSKITFLGEMQDKEWPHFLWSIVIGGEQFKYKTGLGHYTPKHKDPREGRGCNRKPLNSLADSHNGWIHIPKIEDILHCLISDTYYGELSFNDFCDDSGYSNDSIKAFDVYRDCALNGDKLRKALAGNYNNIKEYINYLEI